MYDHYDLASDVVWTPDDAQMIQEVLEEVMIDRHRHNAESGGFLMRHIIITSFTPPFERVSR